MSDTIELFVTQRVGKMNIKKFVVIALIFSCLNACAPSVRTDVTRFNEMPSTQGQTFVIEPSSNEQGSLEYKQYAQLIRQKLEQNGFHFSEKKSGEDYKVKFTFGIDNGSTSTVDMPLYGQTGGGTTTFQGNSMGSVGGAPYSSTSFGTSYTAPTYGEVGSVPISVTTYTRFLTLGIWDAKSLAQGKGDKVFEANAISKGSSSSLPTVMPLMIDAVFQDFPGKNGETITVTAPLSK